MPGVLKATLIICSLLLLSLPGPAGAQGSAQGEAAPVALENDAVDEVLVVGEQPGPGLWKVYSGDHVLWILGTLLPIPQGMQWHSRQVEAVIAESQEFLKPPEVNLEVSFWGKVSLLPSLVGVKNNPQGQHLNDVLSPELYERWLQLKQKYIGNDAAIERHRPIFAATQLFKTSIVKSGLTNEDSVRWRIEAIVKANHIKTTVPVVERELANPRALVKQFKQTQLDDTTCFASTLARLETDLEAMRLRANAWAKGDIAGLRQLPYRDERQDCEAAVINSQLGQEQGLQAMKAQLQTAWLAAATAALHNNPSSFAILPMRELLVEDGFLAGLKALGYSVEAAGD